MQAVCYAAPEGERYSHPSLTQLGRWEDLVTAFADLAERVVQHLDALDARTTLYAKHLESQQELAVRADQVVNPLSTIKLPLMVLAYRDAEAGLLDFAERYTVRPEDWRLGSGLLQSFAPGLQ